MWQSFSNPSNKHLQYLHKHKQVHKQPWGHSSPSHFLPSTTEELGSATGSSATGFFFQRLPCCGHMSTLNRRLMSSLRTGSVRHLKNPSVCERESIRLENWKSDLKGGRRKTRRQQNLIKHQRSAFRKLSTKADDKDLVLTRLDVYIHRIKRHDHFILAVIKSNWTVLVAGQVGFQKLIPFNVTTLHTLKLLCL